MSGQLELIPERRGPRESSGAQNCSTDQIYTASDTSRDVSRTAIKS